MPRLRRSPSLPRFGRAPIALGRDPSSYPSPTARARIDGASAAGTDDAARGPAPSDANLDALIVAWSALDERARDALLRSAEALGCG